MEEEEALVLNVGGVVYAVAASTLRRDPDSMLGRMFAPENARLLKRNGKGEIFLDRDGAAFGHVLRFLRDNVAPPDADSHAVWVEANYFLLEPLLRCLESKRVAEAARIASKKEKKALALKEECANLSRDNARLRRELNEIKTRLLVATQTVTAPARRRQTAKQGSSCDFYGNRSSNSGCGPCGQRD